ncbi:MAG: hypothetical protein AB7P35_17865 [Hyphomonadaceae bacterium]
MSDEQIRRDCFAREVRAGNEPQTKLYRDALAHVRRSAKAGVDERTLAARAFDHAFASWDHLLSRAAQNAPPPATARKVDVAA